MGIYQWKCPKVIKDWFPSQKPLFRSWKGRCHQTSCFREKWWKEVVCSNIWWSPVRKDNNEKEKEWGWSLLGKGVSVWPKTAVLWDKKWFNSLIGRFGKTVNTPLVQFQNRNWKTFYSKSTPNDDIFRSRAERKHESEKEHTGGGAY